MPIEVDADPHGRLLIVGDGLQRQPGPAPAKEPAHRGDGHGGDEGRGELARRDQHPVHGERLRGEGERNHGGNAPEHHGAGPAHQGAETEGDHDDGDQRLSDQSAQDHAADREGQRDHAQTREAERSGEAETHGVQARGYQHGGQHDPFAQGEVDHARRLVDDHEGEGDQGVEGAGERTVHEQGDEEEHAAGAAWHSARAAVNGAPELVFLFFSGRARLQ